MKWFSLLLLIFLASCATAAFQPLPPAPVTGSIYFPPRGEETEAILRELTKARNSILVQSFSLFSAPVAEALVSAQEGESTSKFSWTKALQTSYILQMAFL